MTEPLYINQEDPIDFSGSLDATPNLQMLHGGDSLADYDQAAHADHEDLSLATGIVRVRTFDFSVGATTWTLTVVHDPGGGAVSWARGADHSYCDFGPMTTEQDVDITATSDASPPQTKTRRIRVKVTPIDPQPDRPRG